MLDFEIEQTVARIKNGERNGFIAFFNHTFQYMFTRSKYLFPNNIESTNFLAATYHNIFMSIQEFNTSFTLESWLTTKILFTYNQILKANQIDAFLDVSDFHATSPLTLETTLASKEYLKEKSIPILANAIHKLPALPKIVALAFYHDGLHSAQIAEILECPEIYISWELGKSKEFLQMNYQTYARENATELYPFSLPLIYASYEELNKRFTVTKEFANIVWENISADLIFCKPKRKKMFTLPLFLTLSLLILAFLALKVFGNSFSKSSSASENKSAQAQSVESDTSVLLPQKPTSTTTIKDANGNTTTYDENGSEISPSSSINSTKKNSTEANNSETGSNSENSTFNSSGYSANKDSSNDTGTSNNSSSSSNNGTSNNSSSSSNNGTSNNSSSSSNNGTSNSGTKNAASDNSKAASNHTVTAPSVSTPTVNTPTVNAPSVNTPSINTPSAPTP